MGRLSREIRESAPRPGRNGLCYCGFGRKFRQCSDLDPQTDFQSLGRGCSLSDMTSNGSSKQPSEGEEAARGEVHWCDLFRDLERFGAVDPRYASRSVLDPQTGARKMTLEDHWCSIKVLALHDGVPSRVQIHFDTARNLLLHSWHVFRFQQVAEMHAFASVEYALRVRAGLSARDKANLPKLLPLAVKNGWIRADGFRLYRAAVAQRQMLAEPEDSVTDGQAEVQSVRGLSYVGSLIKVLPELRNELAHGTAMLRPSGKRTLALCCDLINQLFRVETSS